MRRVLTAAVSSRRSCSKSLLATAMKYEPSTPPVHLLKFPSSVVRQVNGSSLSSFAEIQSHSVLSGRKILLFGCPGAFTEPHSNQQLADFMEHSTRLKQLLQLDGIYCLVPNDSFVANAWIQAAKVSSEDLRQEVHVLADVDRQFIQVLNVDQVLPYFGSRCERFVMIIDDGDVQDYRIEIDPFDYSTTSSKCLIADYEQKSQHQQETTFQMID
eukprot:TRINITY_DN26514_c0_g1_i1.p1 TRINITY_DN26514_c0_g1~~TRINITY_DN26514_c0_g1_i1.p1  ORF type:complete len:225 (-),score=51.12 TRINITY_DN26514_c0_g1_i1:48-689(-)